MLILRARRFEGMLGMSKHMKTNVELINIEYHYRGQLQD